MANPAYAGVIAGIEHAPSFEAIDKIVGQYSAHASGPGGALYSGKVGPAATGDFVEQIREHSNIPVIDNTARAQLLSDVEVKTALLDRARELYHARGLDPAQSAKAAGDFLYGNENALQPEGKLQNCQWGRASSEFAQSLKGDVLVVASEAAPGRVFGAVELRAALANKDITSLGGVPTSELRTKLDAAHGDITGVLEDVQARFRADLAKGVFRDSADKLVLSKEFADSYHLSGDFKPKAQLEAAGLQEVRSGATAVAAAKGGVEGAEAGTARPGTGAVSKGGIEGAETGAAEGSAVLRGLGHAGTAATVVLLAYDAARVTKQYGELASNGNFFAANAMLRTEALRTGGGLVGGMVVGAGVGALAGSETGPGALITGAVGGIVGGVAGAIGGEKLAEALNERAISHQPGADGQEYAFKDGAWKQEHGWFHADTAAPAGQLPTLDYHRTAAITEMAIANPPHPDPNRIDAPDPKTHVSMTWVHQNDGSWQAHPDALGWNPAVTASDPKFVAQLNDVSAQRKFVDAHAPQLAAEAFVVDYYGKRWDKLGPLPEPVTNALGRPNETHVTDPQTHQTWKVEGNAATQEHTVYMGRYGARTETVSATGDELARVVAARDQAVASNHEYGAALIDRSYQEMEREKAPIRGQEHSELTPAETPGHPNGMPPETPDAPNKTLAALGVSSGDYVTVRAQGDDVVAQIATPGQQQSIGRSA